MRLEDVGAVSTRYVGVLDFDQSVALRTDNDLRRPVVLRVGTDEAKQVVRVEDLGRNNSWIPVATPFRYFTELSARREVPVHLLWREDVRASRSDNIFEPVERCALERDSAVRSPVGEELRDELGRRPPALFLCDLLDHAASD